MKEILGFKTQKIFKETIQKIVHNYSLEQEFFHPLLQDLFIQRPYWCDPPGPTFVKFKWIKQEFPNGKKTEKWFMCFSKELGWQSRSWNKCIVGEKINLEKKLKRFARHKIMSIMTEYKNQNLVCEFEGCKKSSSDVHHVYSMKDILKKIISESNILEEHDEEFDPFKLTNDSLFVKLLFDRHKVPECLMALCKSHHYEIENKVDNNTEKYNSVISFLEKTK